MANLQEVIEELNIPNEVLNKMLKNLEIPVVYMESERYVQRVFDGYAVLIHNEPIYDTENVVVPTHGIYKVMEIYRKYKNEILLKYIVKHFGSEKELAKVLGCTENTITSCIAHNIQTDFFKVIRYQAEQAYLNK